MKKILTLDALEDNIEINYKIVPSACNTQLWRSIAEKNIVKIYRSTKIKFIMPKEKVPYLYTNIKPPCTEGYARWFE